MKKYLGIKLIEAEPFRKQGMGEDCKNEFVDKYEEGYKVIYEDGYESWSPKDVFEKAYRKIKVLDYIGKTEIDYGFQERVWNEAEELQIKVEALNVFVNVNNIIFLGLEKEEQARLKQQLMAMQYYLTILVERIENFK